MEAEKLRDIVLKLVDREPGLLFDLVEGVDDGNGGSPSPNTGSPSWCRCGNCREMPTELERKCCNCLPRNCVSQRDVSVCYVLIINKVFFFYRMITSHTVPTLVCQGPAFYLKI